MGRLKSAINSLARCPRTAPSDEVREGMVDYGKGSWVKGMDKESIGKKEESS
jgi:hypothetical protein